MSQPRSVSQGFQIPSRFIRFLVLTFSSLPTSYFRTPSGQNHIFTRIVSLDIPLFSNLGNTRYQLYCIFTTRCLFGSSFVRFIFLHIFLSFCRFCLPVSEDKHVPPLFSFRSPIANALGTFFGPRYSPSKDFVYLKFARSQ